MRTITFAALVALGASSCAEPAVTAPTEMPPAPVTVFAAVAKDVPLYLDQIGRVVPSELVSIMPRVSGPIMEIRFEDGTDVREKAPLFQIDARPYQAKLDEAKARVTSAEADVTQMKAARDTAKVRIASATSRVEEARAKLVAVKSTAEEVKSDVAAAEADSNRAAADVARFEGASGAVSSMDLDRMRAEARSSAARLLAARRRESGAAAQQIEAEAAEKTADAGVREAESLYAESEARVASFEAAADSARAAVETARLDVEFCSIAAPITGRAGRRLFDIGNVVRANESVLLSIQKIDPVAVEFTIAEKQLTEVQASLARAMTSKSALDVEVRLPDVGGEARKGTLAFLDNVVMDATGTVKLRARLDNADGKFWPGRFVKVRLILDTIRGAVLIPSGAPQVSGDGATVSVVKADSTAEMRPITIGQRHGELVVAKTGLASGELVVVTGPLFLKPGSKVSIVTPTPPPGPGAAPVSAPSSAPAMSEGSGK